MHGKTDTKGFMHVNFPLWLRITSMTRTPMARLPWMIRMFLEVQGNSSDRGYFREIYVVFYPVGQF